MPVVKALDIAQPELQELTRLQLAELLHGIRVELKSIGCWQAEDRSGLRVKYRLPETIKIARVRSKHERRNYREDDAGSGTTQPDSVESLLVFLPED